MQKRKEGAICAGRPIHEMGTSVLLIFLTERGLTAMRNRLHSHSTAQHSTAQANCALFASCGRKTHGTEYYIRDG